MTSLLSVYSKRSFLIAGAILFLILANSNLALFAKQVEPSPESDDVIVAKVNGIDIGKSTYDSVVQNFKTKSGKKELTTEDRTRLIQNIIIRQLILQHASIPSLRQDEEFKQKIDWYEKETLIKLFLEKEIGSKLIATDEEMKEYYRQHPDKFKGKKRVTARVILVRTREDAQTVLSKIKDGQDFSTLVKKYSVDLPSVKDGGILEIEEGKFYPQIQKAVFSLKKNEISDIIETEFGFNLFKIEKIIPAKVRPYEEVKDLVKENLMKYKEARAFFEMAAGLEKEADITIFEELLSE